MLMVLFIIRYTPTIMVAIDAVICTHCMELTTDEERSLRRIFVFSKKSTVFSHLVWICPSAPKDLTVSIATRLSIRVAFFNEFALFVVSDSSRICPCTRTAWSSINNDAINKGITSCHEIKAMTIKNNNENGRST